LGQLFPPKEKEHAVKPAKKMSGDVYYPSQDMIAQARLKDWDALAASADKDLEGFWAKEADELEKALLQMVRGEQGQHRPQRGRPSPEILSEKRSKCPATGRSPVAGSFL
jgi:hypothetical protein